MTTISEYIKEREGEFNKLLSAVDGIPTRLDVNFLRDKLLGHRRDMRAFHLASLKGLCEVIQAMGEGRKKTWPLWGHDTPPAEGNTESKKDKNEGYNDALADLSEEITNEIKKI